MQYFTVVKNDEGGGGIIFHNSALAGTETFYIIAGDPPIFFEDSASADAATFQVNGRVSFYDESTAGNALIEGGGAEFYDNSSAGDAQIHCVGGGVSFSDESTAGNANITVSDYGFITFDSTATGGQAHFTLNGGISADSLPGAIDFFGAFAGTGTFVVNGGSAPSAPGAQMNFLNAAHAENATIIVNGGTNGGEGASLIFDKRSSDGGMASITLNGNGSLNLAELSHVTTGSIAGDGLVFLGNRKLKIGSNNASTKFSGLIQDGPKGADDGIIKIGSGTWTLTGANTYVGGTTLIAGGLTIDNKHGSGTGTGPVQVTGGTLGGSGIIAGATTLGTGSGSGAVLAPGAGATRPVTLTMQSSLTFQADATLQVRLNTNKAKADAVAANGVTIASGAQFILQTIAQAKLSSGATFTVIDNTSANPIAGTFANLANGSTLQAGPNTLLVDYSGGDGNDLTLTVQ